MTARNIHIEKLVRSNHAALFKDRLLSIFCISNKTYKKNRRRVKVHDLPMKGSGVPALRSHCHKIPARAQFRVAHHFLTVSLKGLVQRVQLWLSGGSQETLPNEATVQRMLETLQDDLQQVRATSSLSAKEPLLVITLNFSFIIDQQQCTPLPSGRIAVAPKLI
jgi:hypothetical protein